MNGSHPTTDTATHEAADHGHTLCVEGARIGYPERRVIEGMNLQIPRGRVSAIVGPNGSGKSTLLHAMARIIHPHGGHILLDGKDIHRWSSTAVARILALLPQSPEAPEEATVWDLVAFGRFPYRGWFGAAGPDDDRHIADALATVNLTALADRPVATLSGGQRQRVWIAMALAQETPYLLLDEPATFLDLAHQLELMALVQDLNRQRGKTVVLVLHDLNLAARYADHMIMLKDGAIATTGSPAAVMTPAYVRAVFDVDGSVIPDPQTGTPVLLPIAPVRSARDDA